MKMKIFVATSLALMVIITSVIFFSSNEMIEKEKKYDKSNETFSLQAGDLAVFNDGQLYEIISNTTTIRKDLHGTISFYAFNLETYTRPGWYIKDKLKRVYKIGTEEHKEMAVKFITPWQKWKY